MCLSTAFNQSWNISIDLYNTIGIPVMHELLKVGFFFISKGLSIKRHLRQPLTSTISCPFLLDNVIKYASYCQITHWASYHKNHSCVLRGYFDDDAITCDWAPSSSTLRILFQLLQRRIYNYWTRLSKISYISSFTRASIQWFCMRIS
jgi:hypothetical protein